MAYYALPLYTLWGAMDAPKDLYGVPCATPLCPMGVHGRPTMVYHALPVYALWVAMDAPKYLYGVPCATQSLNPLSPSQKLIRIPSQPNRVYKTRYHPAKGPSGAPATHTESTHLHHNRLQPTAPHIGCTVCLTVAPSVASRLHPPA
jgi:hypothetical protein